MPNPLPKISAVVFDMDGVLLDTEPLYLEAMTIACRDLGYQMTRELHLAQVGMPWEACMNLMQDAFGADFPFDAYNDNTHQVMQGLLAGGVPVKPGVRDLLDELRLRGIPAAVATSTSNPAAGMRLRETGLFDLFAAIVTRSDVSKGKPHPEPFLKAAERLGIPAGNCLALEDSHTGIRSAHAAGLIPVMVPDMLPPSDEIEQLCHAVLPSLDAVRSVYFSAVA